jgi:phospholipid/cholesterol/gamma-HCH transport system substrate-binding protein
MTGRRRSDVMVGAVVLLGIALVVVGVIWLKGSGFGREEHTVVARFREVGQLLKGSSVKLRGVPIGRVAGIALDPSGAGVLVSMRIRSDVTLPEDPVVLLSPESMFGDWQAEIAPRSSFAQYNYAEAQDPGVLPGYSLPDISRLTAVADEIAGNMATLSSRFEIAFTDETANNVRIAIENIQEVSEQLTGMVGGQQRAINEVATNLREATETLGRAAETVQRAFAQVETAVGEDRLISIVENVERTTARSDSLTRQLLAMSQDLRQAALTAEGTLSSLGVIADGVQRGEGSLGRLLVDTTLYVGLRESSIELQSLLKDVRENPRRYITVRVF